MEFSDLLPKTIFDAVFAQGFHPTGALLPLNSYENRVYEIGVEDHDPLIAKFYRPGRWSAEAIAEEHRFIQALADLEIPVVGPMELKGCISGLGVNTLSHIDGMYFTFYPKFRGRERPELMGEDRRWLGRLLARLHNVGESFVCRHRMTLNPETYGWQSLDFILRQTFIPHDIKANLKSMLESLLKALDEVFKRRWVAFPVHGDCHPGNVLWNTEGPHLVDFDDMVIAPPIQDLWMLFYGSPEEIQEQRKDFFEGYSMFRKFDESTFLLSEPLRTLRMIRHASWIGQRYAEPIFQKAFPYYQDRRYWEQFLLSLKEQSALLQGYQ